MLRSILSNKKSEVCWFQRPLYALLFLLIALCPLGAAAFVYYSRSLALSRASIDFEHLQLHVNRRIFQEREKREFLNNFQNVDHYYVEKYLESISLLTSLKKTLETVSENPALNQSEEIKSHLARVIEEKNTMQFTEIARESKANIEEIELKQMRPAEVEMMDLKKVLAIVEGVCIDGFSPFPNRPQLLIKSFDLSWKKDLQAQEKLWLTMDIIKREAI